MRCRWPGLALLLWASLAPSCVEEGSLRLQLVRAVFDSPYAGVDQFQLRVLDGSFAEVERLTTAAGQDSLDLGVVGAGSARLDIRGLSAGTVVGRGQSRALELECGAALDEPVPFSTPRVAVALPASRVLAPAITVDGNLAEWRASPSLVLDDIQRVFGAKATPADLRVELMLAWGGEELAFALQVEDDCPGLREGLPAGRCGPALAAERIALGFDGADDGGTDYGPGDLWLEIEATGVAVRRGGTSPAELAVVVAPRSDLRGWTVEGKLRVSALGRTQLTGNDRVGFDLVVVDHDPSEPQPTVLRWSGPPGPWAEPTGPERMCTLGFGEPKR